VEVVTFTADNFRVLYVGFVQISVARIILGQLQDLLCRAPGNERQSQPVMNEAARNLDGRSILLTFPLIGLFRLSLWDFTFISLV